MRLQLYSLNSCVLFTVNLDYYLYSLFNSSILLATCNNFLWLCCQLQLENVTNISLRSFRFNEAIYLAKYAKVS